MQNELALKEYELKQDAFETFCDDFEQEINQLQDELGISNDDAASLMYNEYRWPNG